MHLKEFVKEIHEQANQFEKYWLDEHNKNPDYFPLELEDDNDGLWWELFIDFDKE